MEGSNRAKDLKKAYELLLQFKREILPGDMYPAYNHRLNEIADILIQCIWTPKADKPAA